MKINMMLQYYKYPLKVWLTSTLLGTLFSEIVNYLTANDHNYQSDYFVSGLSEAIFFIFIFFGLSSLLSVPCWLLFWLIYHQALKYFSKLSVKLLMLGVGQSLAVALGYVVLGDLSLVPADAYIMLCYCSALFAATLMYKVDRTVILEKAPLH